MNVLALVTEAFGGKGGIAQYNRDFLEAFAKLQRDAKVIVLPRYAPLPFSTPENINQAEPSTGRLAFNMRVLLASVRTKADVVFCGHLILAPLAVVIARISGAKLIIQMHGIEAWPRPTLLQRFGVEHADLVLSVSRYTRSRVAAWAAIEPARLIVVPNTVAEDCSPGDGSQFRARCNLHEQRILLAVGRFDATESYKGHDRIIAALPRLAAAGHDVVFVVLGEGNQRFSLEQLARDYGVPNRVRFMGSVSRKIVIEAYRAADLFVMPSTGEGFGFVFLESMACGTPALGLAVAGALDALGDGELGMVTAEQDLVHAIERILNSRSPDRGKLAVAVRARFGKEAFRSRVRHVLGRVVPPCNI